MRIRGDRGRSRRTACARNSPGTVIGFEGGRTRVERRLVGIDLGIASAHTVRVLDAAGREVRRCRTGPPVAEFSRIEDAALAGAGAGTRLEVVLEPTGPSWLPVVVFFCGRGHVVHRVSSAKAGVADLYRPVVDPSIARRLAVASSPTCSWNAGSRV
jgi:hypothetical protein